MKPSVYLNYSGVQLGNKWHKGELRPYRKKMRVPTKAWRDFLSVLEFRLAVGSRIWNVVRVEAEKR